MRIPALVVLLAMTGCASSSSTKSREPDYPAVIHMGCGVADGPRLDVSIDAGYDEIKLYIDESGYSKLENAGKLVMDSASISTSELSITVCQKGATDGCHFVESGELTVKHFDEEEFSGHVNYTLDGTAREIDFHATRWTWPGGFCG